ncbi:hypothetical protein FF38_02845 [Lucilia cuprina]|uniref:Uncharacterized protein n=1 Tax=Lucilia cuprina TaxID=7375 RepID=A0A0L0CGL0_LUCCU|nr:hypothetical protein FF38_02845 [Lucilia cuprina]
MHTVATRSEWEPTNHGKQSANHTHLSILYMQHGLLNAPTIQYHSLPHNSSLKSMLMFCRRQQRQQQQPATMTMTFCYNHDSYYSYFSHYHQRNSNNSRPTDIYNKNDEKGDEEKWRIIMTTLDDDDDADAPKMTIQKILKQQRRDIKKKDTEL